MSEKKELSFILTISGKIISVNNLYKAGFRYINGKPKPYIYKNPKANEMEREIIEQLRAVDFSEYKDWLTDTKYFDITISFILKSNVTRKDVFNLDKALIDDITRFIKNDVGISRFDDSLFASSHFYKSIIPKSKHEYACIKITESKSNLRFDQIDQPDKFYLGSEEIEWKKEIRKELKSRKLKSYEKPEEEEKCNSHLYFLTPNSQTRTLEVANIINVVWECITSEFGFVFIGVMDKNEENDKLIELVKSISSDSSRIKIGYIEQFKDILDL